MLHEVGHQHRVERNNRVCVGKDKITSQINSPIGGIKIQTGENILLNFQSEYVEKEIL